METITVEALTVVLLSLPLRWQQNCLELTGLLSLVCRRKKSSNIDCCIHVVASRAQAKALSGSKCT